MQSTCICYEKAPLRLRKQAMLKKRLNEKRQARRKRLEYAKEKE